MSTKATLHELIDRLDEEREPAALLLLRRLVEPAAGEGGVGADDTPTGSPPVLSGRAFREQRSKTWQELVAEQGVRPISSMDELLGDFWPEEDSIDDFLAAVREWRRGD